MNLDMEGHCCSKWFSLHFGFLGSIPCAQSDESARGILQSAIRFSWGLGNTTKEIITTAEKLEPFLNGCVIDPKGLFTHGTEGGKKFHFHRLDRSGLMIGV